MFKNVILFLAGIMLLSNVLSGQKAMQTPVRTYLNDEEILNGFTVPPKGYGEVPFYWWQGDTLTKERITWQLDRLQGKGISSLQINYSHRDFGGLLYGLSNPSKPPLFSEAWWNLFRWFAGEASRRGMTVSLSDYTIGVGQGFAMDEAIKDIPSLNGSLLASKKYFISGKSNIDIPSGILTLKGYRMKPDSSVIPDTRRDLIKEIKNGKLSYNFGNDTWVVIAVYPDKVIPSFDPMNPESGKAYNKYFFSRFEDALPGKGAGMLNFFFSDELNFRLSGNLWNAIFAGEFMRRKGYDIVPQLDKLFIDGDPSAPKIRMDYNDVIVTLSEENFFEPVYRWHQDRGLTFGCDHGGRGREVTEFGDYFRTQRWNQGPGSDQPRLSKDIIKAKVASSISHLYERPRVWLEGFHSSGWGTSSADVTDAILANFVAGYNLLSFHGLYYSTMGGWWEWAPPDNHFRMPYWNQIDPLMNCVQRLSFLLSQGYHNCDIAILYPTEPVVAELDGDRSVECAFSAGEELYNRGLDFDFIDFESIARSKIENGELTVAGERYKVLVVPSMKAIKISSLDKLEAFAKAGGLVVNLGAIPVANDLTGMNDAKTNLRVNQLFKENKNVIQCDSSAVIPSVIKGRYEPGFSVLSPLKERPYVTHRIIGSRDIYFLYNFPKDTKCFFSTKGSVQLWDPWTATVSSISSFAAVKENGTEISLPLEKTDIQIIVFDHKGNTPSEVLSMNKLIRETDLGNEWEFRLKPSLDNTWGDFDLPAGNELIGATVSRLFLAEDEGFSGGALEKNNSWRNISCGYGPQFIKIGPLPAMPSEKEIQTLISGDKKDGLSISGKLYPSEEYAFSWQKGVEGDYGHQGFHGLKGEMYDNFIRLGATEDVNMSLVRVPEPGGNFYVLLSSVLAPQEGQYDLLCGKVKPVLLLVNNAKSDISQGSIHLKKGANSLLLIYEKACETYLVFRQKDVPVPPKQQISMKWYKDNGVLPFAAPVKEINSGLFVFEAAPGLQSITFSAYGKIDAWIGGKKAEIIKGSSESDGLADYTVKSAASQPGVTQVVIRIEYQPGYYGGSALPYKIKENCGTGKINLGDWSETDGLRSYSGGAWYRKSIQISKEDIGKDLVIDLGSLISSAELIINGKSAGVRPAPPYRFDISKFARAGENDIEVLVYNTLSNHYTAIPTRYRGDIRSGLFGPVILKVYGSDGK